MSTLIDALKGLQSEMEADLDESFAQTHVWHRELSKIIAEHERSGGWMPIETAPTNGKWIQLWWPEVTDAAFAGFCVDGVWHAATQGSTWRGIPGPTHWQPLPKGPTE